MSVLFHLENIYTHSAKSKYFIFYFLGFQSSDEGCFINGAVVVVIVWQLDLQLPVQSVPIITKVVSSSPVHGEVYSIQHYVIKFVSDLRQVGGFIGNSTNNTHRHDITEISLIVALNTITPYQYDSCKIIAIIAYIYRLFELKKEKYFIQDFEFQH